MSARAAPASVYPGTDDGRCGSAITSARSCFRSANGRRLPPTSIAGPPPAGARPPPAAPSRMRRPASAWPSRAARRYASAAPWLKPATWSGPGSWPRGPPGAARGTRASLRAAPALQRARLSFRAQEFDELLRRRGEVLALPVDDPERPEEHLVREVHDRERLRLDLEPHRGLGQDGEPGADLDHPLDGLHVVELHHIAHLDAIAPEQPVGLPARRDVALVADQRLAGELADRDPAMAGERMVRRADEHQAVVPEGQHGDAGAPRRVRHHADVDVALQDVLVDAARAAVREVEVDLRVGLQVALDLRRQLVETDRVDGRHPHRARDHVGQRLEARLHVLVALDDLLAHLIKDLARGGELHVAARPLEEAATVAILEGADLLADRRLGHEVLGSGRGEAPRLDHVAEDLEGLEVHANASIDRA